MALVLAASAGTLRAAATVAWSGGYRPQRFVPVLIEARDRATSLAIPGAVPIDAPPGGRVLLPLLPLDDAVALTAAGGAAAPPLPHDRPLVVLIGEVPHPAMPESSAVARLAAWTAALAPSDPWLWDAADQVADADGVRAGSMRRRRPPQPRSVDLRPAAEARRLAGLVAVLWCLAGAACLLAPRRRGLAALAGLALLAIAVAAWARQRLPAARFDEIADGGLQVTGLRDAPVRVPFEGVWRPTGLNRARAQAMSMRFDATGAAPAWRFRLRRGESLTLARVPDSAVTPPPGSP